MRVAKQKSINRKLKHAKREVITVIIGLHPSVNKAAAMGYLSDAISRVLVAGGIGYTALAVTTPILGVNR
jgi:hypothetical protein